MIARKFLTTGVTAALAVACGFSSAAYAANSVFSDKFLNKYCQRAQDIIAATDLSAENIRFTDVNQFVSSDALPYDDENDEPLDLPLTTTQYVTEATAGYAQTVWCKMKSYDSLNDYYPGSVDLDPLPAPPFFAGKPTCSDVNRKMVEKSIKQLRKDVPDLNVPEIVYEDIQTFGGPQWTSNVDNEPPPPFPPPSASPSAYISSNDGLLHIVGKELFVTRFVPFFINIPNSKKGVDYCQGIAPEYVREILTGNVVPPTCGPPPVYIPGQSPFAQTWETYPGSGVECANP